MVDMTNDVARFEDMFADRFTENDNVFMELKCISLSHPVVIHPWKTQRKIWNKRWDYSSQKNQEDRSQREKRNYRNDDRNRDRSREGGNSRDRYRDRSHETEHPRDRYRDRSHEREHSRDRYGKHTQDGNSRSRER